MHMRVRLPSGGDVTLGRVVLKTSGKGKRRVSMHARNPGALPDSAVVVGSLRPVKGKKGVFAGLVAISNRKSQSGLRATAVVDGTPAARRRTAATILDVVVSGRGRTRVRPVSITVANDLIAESAVAQSAAQKIVDRSPRARTLLAGAAYFDPGAPAAMAPAGSFLQHVVALAGGVAHDVSKDELDRLVAALESDAGGNLRGGNNKAPVPAFGFSPNSPPSAPKVGQTVLFNGENSSDADGQVARWEWSFGDGSAAEGKTAAHSYGQPGIFKAQLRVTDDEGKDSEVTAQGEVYVSGPGKTEGDSELLNCPVNSGDTLTIDWFAVIPSYAERPVATWTNPCPGATQSVTLTRRDPGNNQNYVDPWNRPGDTYRVQIKWTGPGPAGQAKQHLTVTWE